ncbi:phosphatase PAP2 family protein [Ottowia sp. SB7-C50]|uniref:acid phosphatase n=1 Tax=Ottowia sp. SB7-C50 TaxID=3081231 RepID=UPI002954A76A|nr:phosphatase PAP2 family protein [Ottowia sp. SB7-C50]WOP15197.1 phosphatase PAP2 family protein [Ottowia sp. SB7-C50]
MRLTRASRTLATLGLTALLAACASTSPPTAGPTPPTDPAQIGELRPGLLNGYLDRAALPDSLALLPPPPDKASALRAADEAAYRATRPLLATPRGAQAAVDAKLDFPAAASTFACAAQLDITPEATPHLYTVLRRTLVDAGGATYRAKDHYRRVRPFAEYKDGSCTPDEEARLMRDGSYPSGHAALGWAWALVLAELMPERADALLQRGHAYGQSRVICGVHWQSDVEAGRLMGAAAVARLHAHPPFQAQMRAAASEIRAARAGGRGTGRDCAAEAAALKP